ncbi:MAG: HD domain-containing protein [Ilumatobacter sp.]|nr:HD domain-containing protein [Ilumatobacter sp.]
MDGQQHDRHGWVERPVAARAVGATVYIVPFVASVVAAFMLSSALPPAPTVGWGIIRWLGIAALSTIVLVAVERQTRRLLPLRALLGMTLAFPDRAPSRFRIASRTGTTNQLRERLEDARAGRLGDTPSEAAERLLELVGMLSLHDRTTRGHSERVRAYTHLIAEELGVSGQELDRLRWAGLLHDVGKLAISGEILNKPGRLTTEEYDVIKTHAMEGKRLVAPLADWLGESVRAVWEHHERWDGKGYPVGLAGSDISLAARVVAVADTYDVMTSVRSYKSASSPAAARAELARCAGTQFDPECVRAFLAVSVSRRRGTMGPLSWVAQLSLFPQSIAAQAGPVLATTAAVTAGAAAGSVGMAAGPIEVVTAHEQLPAAVEPRLSDEVFDLISPSATIVMVDTAAATTSDATDPTRGAGAAGEGASNDALAPPPAVTPDPVFGQSASEPASSGELPADTVPVGNSVVAGPPAVAPVSPGATTSPPTVVATSPVDPPTAVAATPPGTTVPSMTLPATTVPPTAVPPATVPPTAVPPTTVPTTTVPPTTVPPTTVPPTTVPPAPISGEFFLASSGVGPVASSEILPMSMSPPIEYWLYNYDTDRDNDEGLALEASEDGVNARDADEVQAFRHPLTGTVDGGITAKLYVAAEDFEREDIAVEVSVRRCDASGTCEELARRNKTVSNARYFKSLNVSLGSVQAKFAPGDEIELRVATLEESEADMWLAYGTTVFPSSLTFGD